MQDLRDFTVGQILDIFKELIPEEERIYKAGQDDIDRILR